MATQSRAWVIRHEPKRFRSGGINHLIDIDTHFVSHDFHLVDQADVDGTMDVFQELRHFCHLGAADWHYLVDYIAVEGFAHFQACFGGAAYHLWDGAGGEVWVAWVFAFGGINQEDIITYF